jgi:hypothetical protein
MTALGITNRRLIVSALLCDVVAHREHSEHADDHVRADRHLVLHRRELIAGRQYILYVGVAACTRK